MAGVIDIAKATLDKRQYPYMWRYFVPNSLEMYQHRQESAKELFNHHLQVHIHGLSLPTLLIIIYNTIIINIHPS